MKYIKYDLDVAIMLRSQALYADEMEPRIRTFRESIKLAADPAECWSIRKDRDSIILARAQGGKMTQARWYYIFHRERWQLRELFRDFRYGNCKM